MYVQYKMRRKKKTEYCHPAPLGINHITQSTPHISASRVTQKQTPKDRDPRSITLS